MNKTGIVPAHPITIPSPLAPQMLKIVIGVVVWFLLCAGLCHAQSKTALLIAPHYTGNTTLAGADNDVYAMAQLLEYRYGYKRGNIRIIGALPQHLPGGYNFITRDGSAPRSIIREQTKKLAKETSLSACNTLYFTGHGGTTYNGKAKNEHTEFLVASDRLPVFDYEIEELTRPARGRLTLILDTCHSGGVARGASGFRYALPKSDSELVPDLVVAHYLAATMPLDLRTRPVRYADGSNRVVLAACNYVSTAFQIPLQFGGNDAPMSAFTRALYSVLMTTPHHLTQSQLLEQVTRTIARFGPFYLPGKRRVYNQVPDFQGGASTTYVIAPQVTDDSTPGSMSILKAGYFAQLCKGQVIYRAGRWWQITSVSLFESHVVPTTSRVSRRNLPYDPRLGCHVAVTKGIGKKESDEDEDEGHANNGAEPNRPVSVILSPNQATYSVSIGTDSGTAGYRKIPYASFSNVAQATSATQQLREKIAASDTLMANLFNLYDAPVSAQFELRVSHDDSDGMHSYKLGDQIRLEWNCNEAGFVLLLNIDVTGDVTVIECDGKATLAPRATERTYSDLEAIKPAGPCRVLGLFSPFPWNLPQGITSKDGLVAPQNYLTLYKYIAKNRGNAAEEKNAYRLLNFEIAVP